jgi:hypothetical protein
MSSRENKNPYIYIQRGAFAYGIFDTMLSFIHSTVALSIFVWTSLAIVEEETVYYSSIRRRKLTNIK